MPFKTTYLFKILNETLFNNIKYFSINLIFSQIKYVDNKHYINNKIDVMCKFIDFTTLTWLFILTVLVLISFGIKNKQWETGF